MSSCGVHRRLPHVFGKEMKMPTLNRITKLTTIAAMMFTLGRVRDASAYMTPLPTAQTCGVEYMIKWPGVIWDAPAGCEDWTCVYTQPPKSTNTVRSSTEKPVCETSTWGTSTDGGSQ